MWVPSFLWAKRTLTWNARHIRIASNGSAPPWMRKPGAQPLRGAGLHSAASHVGCRACDWMLPKSCVPWSFHFWWQYKYHHWFAFLVNSNRKASMLRLRPWSLGIFLETQHFGKVLSHKFLAHFLTWWPGPWGHHPCKWAPMDGAGSPFWSCVRGSAMPALAEAIFLQSQEIHLPPYTLFYSWYFSMFLQNFFISS